MNALPLLRLVLLSVAALVAAACDGPTLMTVDNQSSSTYIAQTDNGQFLVLPPNRRVTVAEIPFAVPREGAPEAPVRILNSSCEPVAGPFDGSGGTIHVSATGAIEYKDDGSHKADPAESAAFCSDVGPMPSPTGPGLPE